MALIVEMMVGLGVCDELVSGGPVLGLSEGLGVEEGCISLGVFVCLVVD